MTSTHINPNALVAFYHPDYEQPTSDDLRALLKLRKWTGAKTAAIVGVDGRTVRRWTGAERPIPYSAWRLLLINAGIVKS